MPANPDFAGCYTKTSLSDAEIAAIVRGVAVNGQAGPFDFIDSEPDCILAAGHDGDCTGWVATLKGKPGSAWLRWRDDYGTGRIDWLADCAKGDCSLYRGHPGDCMPDLYPDVES
jgi:hypothetical protein